MQTRLIDRWCVVVTIAALLFGWILFWSYTAEPIGSFVAAALAAGLVFFAYIAFRLVWLSFR